LSIRGAGSVRLLVDGPGNGRWNMAVDEALLQGVSESIPVVRLYGFSPPTLSVGRFQRIRGHLDPAILEQRKITLVRRPTGGQAVLHDEELTYAVILGRGHIEPFGKREVYRFIAGLLLRGLEKLGVRGQSSHSRVGSINNPDCFRSTGEYEIASLSERKLIGSAQVLNRSGSLQHGAIPLSDSYKRIAELINIGGESAKADASPDDRPAAASKHNDPASLSEELGRPILFLEAQEAFAAGFADAFRLLGVKLEPDELSREESRLAEELLDKRYERDEWNLKY
jgi:lipoate-protein ligase A